MLYQQKGLDAEPELFLDPNTFSEDGTIALGDLQFNKDGKIAAYSISKSGSDWNEIFLMDVGTKAKLEDHLEWIKFSGISWKDDGFYYSSYDKPADGDALKAKNEYHKVYFHKLGTPQSEDKLIYEDDSHPMRNYYAGTTEDESILILSESEGGAKGNALYAKKLDGTDHEFTLIAEGYDFEYGVIDNLGDQLIIQTNQDAPKWKLVMVDINSPAKENWKVIIPEKEEVLQSVSLIGGKMVATYMKDATSVAYIYDYEGKYLADLSLPGIGTLAGISGKTEDNIAFYTFTSFTFPSAIFKYDVANNTSEIFRKSEIDFDIDAYETKQVFYTSKDGTKVPMFLVHKKGVEVEWKKPDLTLWLRRI